MTNKTDKLSVADVITNRFLEAIKTSGKLPWQKPWRCIMPRNAVSGKPYNGVNVLMLSLFGVDSDFLTFNQAKDNGGMVRKGSKGLPIVYFRFLDKKDKSGAIVTGANGKAKQIPLLRYSTVFNISDIDGCDALKAKAASRVKVIDFQPIAECEKLANAAAIHTNHGGNSAHYSPGIHAVTMPKAETFKSVEAYYKTLFHELGHALGKETGETFGNEFGSDLYAKEELVAELFANFCLSYVGIDASDLFDNSLAYLQNWTAKLTGDPSLLISAASKASKRFNLLLTKAGLLVPVVEESEAEEIEAVVS